MKELLIVKVVYATPSKASRWCSCGQMASLATGVVTEKSCSRLGKGLANVCACAPGRSRKGKCQVDHSSLLHGG